MRTIRPRTSELAIVVAVVAVGTENLRSHRAPWRDPVEIQHIAEQARLRQRAVTDVSNRMARRGSKTELQNDVQRIACGRSSHRKVSVDRPNRLPGAASMTPEAVLVLIDGRVKNGRTVGGADASDVLLRNANERRHGKRSDLGRSMSVVAIDASCMAVVIEQYALGRIMRSGAGREWMTDLGRDILGKDAGRHRR